MVAIWWIAKSLLPPYSRKSFTRASRVSEVNSQASAALKINHPYTRRKPDWVVSEVLRLKVLMGTSGCRKVATTFNRLHAQPDHGTSATVGKSFCAHCIHTHQYALQGLRTEMQSKPPRAVPVNAVWAMDLTFYPDTTGAQHTALGILDHGSRVLTHLNTVANKSS